jgi:hypothetical protein
LFPNHPRCRIPRNFYNDLLTTAFSPNIFQLFTLSAVSGFRLRDWLRFFGFSPHEIARLQLSLPRKRTTLIDATRYGPPPELSCFAPSDWSADRVCPLVPFLRTLNIRRDDSKTLPSAERYLYARVGREDALAFPDLLPGSLLRIDTTRVERHLPPRSGQKSDAIFLIEHARGLVCSRLVRVDQKCFALHASDLPYAQVPLEIGREAKLLGVVDLELRPLRRLETPEVPADLSNFWKPGPLNAARRAGDLGDWIRTSRIRCGLHFREASRQSAHLAELMQDSRYFVASGSLSDYEATARPPRNIHKLFSLCALYGLHLETFLERAGLPLMQLGRDIPPENFWPPQTKSLSTHPLVTGSEFLSGRASLQRLSAQLKELPSFLVHGVAQQFGLSTISVHDIFWVGGSPASFQSRLARVLFAVVDRRRKRPMPTSQSSASEQPLYVLLRRDGSFLCGRTTLKNRDLVVHSFSDGLSEPLYLRNRVDAEVIGQVVGILRQVLPGS